MNDRVLIIGTGPAAAYAVLACMQAGVDYLVLGDAAPRLEQAGAFFLHWLPEWLHASAEPVEIMAQGDAHTYLRKQWGESIAIETSFPPAARTEWWYNSQWLAKVWQHAPLLLLRRPMSDADLLHAGQDFRAVFHTFSTQNAAVPRELIYFPTYTHPTAGRGCNRIEYDGVEANAWVRVTVAWGRRSVEFPRATRKLDPWFVAHRCGFNGQEPKRVMLRDIAPETLSVGASEQIAPNVLPIGRFATWSRHALSHHAFNTVLDYLLETA